MLRSLLTLRKFLFLTLVSHFLSPSTVCLFIPLVFCFTPLLFYPLLIDSFFTQLIILFSLTNGISPVPWVTHYPDHVPLPLPASTLLPLFLQTPFHSSSASAPSSHLIIIFKFTNLSHSPSLRFSPSFSCHAFCLSPFRHMKVGIQPLRRLGITFILANC